MKIICAVLIFICASTACAALGQDGGETRNSYLRGSEIIENSIMAMGGAAAVARLDDISFALNGPLYARYQSRKPDQFDKFPIAVKIAFDIKSDRMTWAQRNNLPGGLLFDNRAIVGGKEPVLLDLQRMIYNRLSPIYPVHDQAIALVPILFLNKVLQQQKVDIRWAGSTTINGRKNEMVDVVWNNNSYTLYFDAQTKLLTKEETLAPDAAVGDDWLESTFSDYQSFDSLLLPTKCRQWQTGKLVLDADFVDYKLNQKIDDSVFKLPPEYTFFQRPTFAFKPVAKNVYVVEGLVGGGYRSLVVALNDGILVVDSPGVSQVSNRVINEIKKTIPDKQIKYLVETHYHDDHTGGVRPYIAEGARIITTTRNRDFFEQMAAARHTLAPDALSTKPQKPDFLFVDDKKTIDDGEHSVEIVNIGSPHAEDMYLIYLPAEKIVFQSDLYNWADNAVTEATVDMVAKIEKLGWQVDTVIGSHSGAVPYQQIRDEVKACREKK